MVRGGQPGARTCARTADHDVRRVRAAADRLRASARQLHQRAPGAVLRLLGPRLIDQRIQCLDHTWHSLQSVASWCEQRDLLDALGEITLHESLDRFVCVLARVFRVEQEAVDLIAACCV